MRVRAHSFPLWSHCLLLALAALASAFVPSGASAEACLEGEVAARGANVDDARSVALQDKRVLRLAGIESFALLQDEDAEAVLKRRLQALIAGVPLRVRLLSDKPDRYGRLPALIAAGDALVQEIVAREGLAIAFASGDPIPCFERILAAEGEAREERRGFWADMTLPAAWPAALEARIGRFAIFEGLVVSVGNRRARSYLNFGTWWSADVTAEIAAGDRERFGGEAELAKLAGRRLRLRGFLEEKGGPMMVVRSPMQVEILPLSVTLNGETP